MPLRPYIDLPAGLEAILSPGLGPCLPVSFILPALFADTGCGGGEAQEPLPQLCHVSVPSKALPLPPCQR